MNTSSVGNLLKRSADAEGSMAPSSKQRRGNNYQASNPFLKFPCDPEYAIANFLIQARAEGMKVLKKCRETGTTPPALEVEARIGSIRSPFGATDMRVMSSGAKKVQVGGGKNGDERIVKAFHCSASNIPSAAPFVAGVSKSHFLRWTSSGLSEPSTISNSFAITTGNRRVTSQQLKHEIVEEELVETVFAGYENGFRICYPGEESTWKRNHAQTVGKMEFKTRLSVMDLCLPAALYDLRLMLALEKVEANGHNGGSIPFPPPNGWTTKRLKRRKTYKRRDRRFAWRIDVTEVSTLSNATKRSKSEETIYEIEVELSSSSMQKLVHENDDHKARKLAKDFTDQLWFMLGQINPLSDVLDVESYLREHTDSNAVKLALAQCVRLKKYNDSKEWLPAIHGKDSPTPKTVEKKIKFIGCMPVNFSRHNIEEVQRAEGGYFLSEKTDGVRYLMIFTGKSVVLLDRKMEGKRPIPAPDAKNGIDEPLQHLIPHVQPGTVLDGEVVIHRKLRRPIYIVFDVLCSGRNTLVHLPFSERLEALNKTKFRMSESSKEDIFGVQFLKDSSISLPLIQKNFVKRTDLDNLIGYVVEEQGLRQYRNGNSHHHLTDGIIFQPNLPYVMGTDHNLLKWKYLDTVTIDVELLPPLPNRNAYNDTDDDDGWRVGVLGEEGTLVDMTRFIKLPKSERLRLEADRNESGAKVRFFIFKYTTFSYACEYVYNLIGS